MSSSASTKCREMLVLRVGSVGFMLLTLIAVLTGCGERSSGPDIQIRPAEPRKVTIQVTAPPRPTADTNLAGQFSGIGGKTSDLFQLAKGRYVLLLDVRGNDRFLAPDTWKIELFRIPDDVVLLDRSGRGVSGRSSGGFLIEDASWKLWFGLNVGDDAHWIVTLRRVGDLPPTTPGPEATAQITKDPQPTPTSAPKPTLAEAPTRASTPTPTRTPELPIPQKHIVEPGESLVKIAERYGTTVSVLIDLNSIQDPSLIRPGQIINIPPNSRTPVPTSTPAPQPTLTPQAYQSCQDVPESRIVVDTQGRRAVPRDLVPSAPDGDGDGFACGGQLGLVPTPVPTPMQSSATSRTTPTPQPRPTDSNLPGWGFAQDITYDDLLRNSSRHIGKTVRFTGKIVQVADHDGKVFGIQIGTPYTVWRVYVTRGQYSWDDAVYIRRSASDPRYLEDDIIEFTARVEGLETYETILGSQVTIPELHILRVRLKPAN